MANLAPILRLSHLWFIGFTGGVSLLSFARLSSGQRQHQGSSAGQQQSIVAGTPTDGQEMPFFVRGERGCGGALIAPDIVLGVAHCQSTYEE